MQVLNIFHVLVAIAMVAFILVQRGPGATAGAAFGSGASGTVFGSRGAGSFLSRTTWVLAMLFCLISLTMAVIVSRTVVTPDTEVGVVGSPQLEEPAVDDDSDSLPGLDDADQDSDLPELDTSNEVRSQGDLPVLEEEPDTVPDTEQGISGEEPGTNG
jgi:preprotein translocase subunit SecG